tara:strand:+ start:10347 stop:10928 length:582 start_codon:yes stop_codon:yes gene_type:complete
MKIIDNLFESKTINDLSKSVDEHVKNNLLFDDQIKVTKSIIDCHGLALSRSKYFPYSQNCWNIFCLKVKKHVVDYCMEYDVDPFNVIPYSCWSERSVYSPGDNTVMDDPDYAYDYDGQVKKTFIRSVYKLKGSLGVKVGEECIQLKQNSLLVYNGTENKSSNIYPRKDGEDNLIFDWYINDPFDVPDWILPLT